MALTDYNNEEHLKVEREFIHLLLNHKSIITDWLNSNLNVEQFDSSHQLILNAVVESYEKDVLLTRKTFLNYIERFVKTKQQSIAQELLYNRVFAIPAKPNDFPLLKKKILESFLLRKSAEIISSFTSIKDKNGSIFAVQDMAEKFGMLSDNATIETEITYENVLDYAPEYIQYMEDVKSGKIIEPPPVKCGIKEIDYAMAIGFRPGTLTLFCSDVGSFKTTIMMNIGLNVWNYGKNVLFVPLEMPKDLMFEKIISREAHIIFDRLQNKKELVDEEIQRAKEWVERRKHLENKFYIMKQSDRTKVSIIRREIEKHIEIFKPDLVVVDYIANLTPDNSKAHKDRNDIEIGEMLKDLRLMGDKFKFAIVSGAQVGREALKRIRKQQGDKVTAHSEDIRGSHDYAADADFVFVQMPDAQQPSALLNLIIVKSRYGKKVFPNGENRTVLDIKPEISLIKGREDWITNIDPSKVLAAADAEQQNTISMVKEKPITNAMGDIDDWG